MQQLNHERAFQSMLDFIVFLHMAGLFMFIIFLHIVVLAGVCYGVKALIKKCRPEEKS